MHGFLNDSLERGLGVERVRSLVRVWSMDVLLEKRESGACGTDGVSSLDFAIFFFKGLAEDSSVSSLLLAASNCCDRWRYSDE